MKLKLNVTLFIIMFNIIPIPAFQDNYIWLIENRSHAVVVDPGDATPVIAELKKRSLALSDILITHHHTDHIGGVDALIREYSPQVYAPAKESYEFKHTPVLEGQIIHITPLNLSLQVIDVGGHTIGHVAYYGSESIFCGDTLFGGGCGRLFEGTPEQMFASLQKIANLPAETAIYCAHEYTERNLQFAKTLENNNPALNARILMSHELRMAELPTIPSSIALELATNPFLRCTSQEIKDNLGLKIADPIEVFTKLRQLRNQF